MPRWNAKRDVANSVAPVYEPTWREIHNVLIIENLFLTIGGRTCLPGNNKTNSLS